jgi:hypothetical protein
MTAFGGRFDPNLSRMIILKCTRVINVNGWCPLGLIVLTFGYDRYLPNVPNRSSVHVRLFSMNGSVGYGALEGLEPRAADKWDACSRYEHCWTVAYCTFAIIIPLFCYPNQPVLNLLLSHSSRRKLPFCQVSAKWSQKTIIIFHYIYILIMLVYWKIKSPLNYHVLLNPMIPTFLMVTSQFLMVKSHCFG